MENDNFYILTLAALAKELCRRGKKEADVLISAGLPLTRFGAEKHEFIHYLSRNKEVTFHFEKKRYKARIARVSVFPQCYAAVSDRIAALPGRVVVVDIGSWTVDIMPIMDGRPQEQECVTIPQGLIRCMREINEECVRQLGQELEESVIQQVMAGKGNLPENYMAIVQGHLDRFVEKIYHIIKEHGYNLDVTPIVFVGGGASVMKKFGTQKGANIKYIEDIRANAKGYEHLGKVFLSTIKGKLR